MPSISSLFVLYIGYQTLSYPSSYKPKDKVLFAVLAHLFEDGEQMCEDGEQMYEDFGQQLGAIRCIVASDTNQ